MQGPPQQNLTVLMGSTMEAADDLREIPLRFGPILLTESAIIEYFRSRLNESGVGKVTKFSSLFQCFIVMGI